MSLSSRPTALLRRDRLAAAAVVAAVTLSACSTSSSAPDPGASTSESTSPASSVSDEPTEPATTDSAAEDSPEELGDAELAALGANELGRVLIMEWHEIQDENDRWANTLETFRAQLRELQERGYRPISVDEFIDGRIDLPAGLSPVLLTFDDSYKEHFFFGPDGETPDPDSVVGILEEMAAQDPTWRPLATFAFYWPYPFRETDRDLIERKLRWLVDNGYDLSNHTYNHDNLRVMSDDEVVANLARTEAELAQVVGDDYQVRSLTLTQGIWPQNRDLAMAGEANGFAYVHDIALEVGFQPTRSPFHAEYDARNVQRVQAWLPEFRRWMDWMDEKPGRRYVSDGQPDRVAYPSNFADVVGDLRGLSPRPFDGELAGSTRVPTSCVGEDDGSAEPCTTPPAAAGAELTDDGTATSAED